MVNKGILICAIAIVLLINSRPLFAYNLERNISNQIFILSTDTLFIFSDTLNNDIDYSLTHVIEEAYIRFLYADLVNTNLIAYYIDNKIFLPLTEVLNKLEIYYTLNPERKIVEGYVEFSDSSYIYDFYNHSFKNKKKSLLFNKKDYYETSTEFYVSPELLNKTLDLNITVSLNTLTVAVKTNKSLPIYKRIKKLRMLNKFKNINYEDRTAFKLARERKIISGGYFDYYLSSNYSKDRTYFNNYNFGLGFELLGGDIDINLDGYLRNKKNNISDYNYKWRYILKNRFIKQIHIGTIINNGLQELKLNGISITNEPIEPREYYSNYLITEKSKPDWLIELYLNDRLIDITKTDALGNYYFNVPLTYGTSYITLKQYGPTGEYYISKKIFRIPFNFLPEREIYYRLNYGKDIYSSNKVGFAKASYGINKWATGSIGIEYNENQKNKFAYFNEIFLRPFSSSVMSFLFVPKLLYKFDVTTIFSSQIFANFNYTLYKSHSIYNLYNLNNESAVDLFIPIDLQSQPINFIITSKFQNGNNFNNQLHSISANFNLDSFNPGISYKLFYTKYGMQILKQSILNLGVLMPFNIANKIINYFSTELLNIQLYYEFNKRKLSQYNFSYSLEFSSGTKIQLNHTASNLNKYSNTQLDLILNFPFARTRITTNNYSILTNIYGSLTYDSHFSKILFHNRTQVGKSSVSCRFFLDENVNKKYDLGEPILKEPEIILNNPSSITKDESGIIRINELNPYTFYNIKLKEGSLKNPQLVPGFKSISFQTEPNSYKIIDYPLYLGSDISGTVFYYTQEKIKSNLSGVKIYIQNAVDSTTVTTTTFTDGSYYYFGLAPGIYKIYIDKEQIKILNCETKPNFYLYEIHKNGESIQNIDFMLEFKKQKETPFYHGVSSE